MPPRKRVGAVAAATVHRLEPVRWSRHSPQLLRWDVLDGLELNMRTARLHVSARDIHGPRPRLRQHELLRLERVLWLWDSCQLLRWYLLDLLEPDVP